VASRLDLWVLERAVKASGLPRIKLHGLRHGHATHLLSAGTNPKVVSERLGHASVSFTPRHLTDMNSLASRPTQLPAVAALVGG
jgi:integrase